MEKTNSISEEINWLGENFRITKYFGSEVCRLERLENSKWVKKVIWKTIYFGHIDVLEEAIHFFKSNPHPNYLK